MYSVFFFSFFLLFWEEVKWYCEDICATKRKNVQQNYNKTIVKWEEYNLFGWSNLGLDNNAVPFWHVKHNHMYCSSPGPFKSFVSWHVFLSLLLLLCLDS